MFILDCTRSIAKNEQKIVERPWKMTDKQVTSAIFGVCLRRLALFCVFHCTRLSKFMRISWLFTRGMFWATPTNKKIGQQCCSSFSCGWLWLKELLPRPTLLSVFVQCLILLPFIRLFCFLTFLHSTLVSIGIELFFANESFDFMNLCVLSMILFTPSHFKTKLIFF